ncbi:MAG: site-specific DNA-methyltransferase [Solirubrobacterales bacterium]|nr:site-specific DNA-methyltransferase [Solirubrobacterales bacterium]
MLHEGFDATAVLMRDDLVPALETPRGVLFHDDCINLLRALKSESVDTVFADPPFNLGKQYGHQVSDNLLESEYVEWGQEWIRECVRILKPGGAFFLYNLPKWNVIFSSYLVELGMDFRHWIAISMKFGLPIPGRLYPAHYSLLYHTKGKPKTFGKVRTPIEICRHCGGDIKDYGGHRGAMNPNGVNLTDVWTDIPPVRHWKFKSKKRTANQLSTKLLERVVHLSTQVDDLVLDPFGGSGTTFAVAERLGRYWIGSEIENCDVIVERFQSDELHHHTSDDFIEALAA